MRVYEYAKENDLSSKEVLDLLLKGGYELASHMAVVPEEGISYLDNILKTPGKQIEETKSKKKDSTGINQKDLLEEEPVIEALLKEDEEEVVDDKHVGKLSGSKLKLKKTENDLEAVHGYNILSESEQSNVGTRKPSRFRRKKARHPFVVAAQEKEDITEITIKGSLPLFEVAEMMGKSDGDLVFFLLRNGMICNRNQVLPVETIQKIAQNFNIKFNYEEDKSKVDEFLAKSVTMGSSRWPIVVIMGHVDHGKTTLLDFLRKKNTAQKEKGGITQHLGAYEVESKHGKIVFLDTPGHEAFSYMRSKGANVTDIAILVVAADDGVKPQTIEAIKHAKKAGVPIIVAVNKIDKIQEDKVPAVLQSIYRMLAENDVLVEEWGGDVICVPISAKTGKGVDELLEMLVLQSELLELKSDPSMPAKAFILESNLEKGFGPVATVICLEGSLRKGDYFACGNSTGKVRLLINSDGERIEKAGPSIPAKVVGFDNFAEIGNWLQTISFEEYKKIKSSKKSYSVASPMVVQPMLPFDASEQNKKQINLLIKTDTRGSLEAVEGSIEKLSKLTHKDCALLSIVFSGIGDVTEGDIDRAEASGAMILTLHAGVEKKASALAQEKNVLIKTFDIIYHLVEYLEEELKKTKEVKTRWVSVSKLLVKKIFDIKKIGVIAGCSVQEGVVSKGNKVVCIRGGRNIGEGIINSLQRERKIVKEVHSGYECGFISEGFQDWQEGDIVHVFAKEKILSE